MRRGAPFLCSALRGCLLRGREGGAREGGREGCVRHGGADMKGIQVSTDVNESGNHTKGVVKDHHSSARELSD